MTNTSATGGYLAPSDVTPPLYGDALVDYFGDLVSGITPIDRDTAVLPAWQEEPPNLPAVGTNWVAIRITVEDDTAYAVVIHNSGTDTDDPPGDDPGSDTIQKQEILSLECSFYGPSADAIAALFRDGLSVAQNREGLQKDSIGFINVSPGQAVPSLVKGKWLYRFVLTATFRRTIQRTYPVLDLKSAGGTVNSEVITDTFNATRG